MSEDKKQKHLELAGSFLKSFREAYEKIHNETIREELSQTIRALEDVRDTEIYFESGERELDKLYDSYLPFLKDILDNYIHLESTWNAKELEKVRKKLLGMLMSMQDTLHLIKDILPQDEIDEASAMAKARKSKQKLDEESFDK